MSKIIRCAIYIRVSSAEQVMHGKSLEAQLRFLTAFAEERGMKIIGHFADEGKTARKELKRRKAIKDLLDYVKRDEVDVILFWKMDRWFRNVADFYKVQDILDAHNCKWIAAAEPSMNLETREGRLNVNIMLSINQNETDTTSERIKFVNEASIKQGKAVFGTPSVPFGYIVKKFEDNTKRIAKDPDTEHIVNDFFEYYMIHQSKQGTLKYINRKYGGVLTINSVLKMCEHTFYYGAYRDNENYCPAYITKEQWDKIQEINKKNIKIKKDQMEQGADVYLFNGLFKCPLCGRALGSARRTRNSGTLYRYYRCINHYTNSLCAYGKVINENCAEDYLLNNLERLYTEQKAMYIEKIFQQNTVAKKSFDINKYKQELERLNKMYQKGRIAEEKYDSEYERLTTIIAENDIIKIDIVKKEKNFAEIEKVLSSDWITLYSSLDKENKRAFWRNIIKSIECNTDHGTIKSVNFFD